MTGKDQTIAALVHTVNELKGQIGSLSQNQQGITLATVDGELRNAHHALSLTDGELAKAVAESNGEKYRQLMPLREEAAARVWQLNSIKNRLEYDGQRMRSGGQVDPRQVDPRQQPQPTGERLDDVAQGHMEKFMSRFPYFDPDGSDTDSLQMKAIDQAVFAEGYLPRTPMYWRTLEKRLAERGFMPEGGGRREEEDREEYQPRASSRRENDSNGSSNGGGRPPVSSGRGGGGRPSGGFRLHPQMREYLESEGLLYEDGLNDQQKGKRSRLLKNWQDNMRREQRGEFDRTR
jgi:hypothetical protein